MAAGRTDEAVQADPAARAQGRTPPEANPDKLVTTEIIARDRQCPKWFAYQPGLSPRAHVERFHVLQLEAQRREHDLRLAQLEAESRRSSEQIQRDSLDIAKATREASDATRQASEAIRDTARQSGDFQERWTRYAMFLGALAVVLAGLSYFAPQLGESAGLMGLGVLLMAVAVTAIWIASRGKDAS